jgi:hypothetical protein
MPIQSMPQPWISFTCSQSQTHDLMPTVSRHCAYTCTPGAALLVYMNHHHYCPWCH